jgi:hypothetical protein
LHKNISKNLNFHRVFHLLLRLNVTFFLLWGFVLRLDFVFVVFLYLRLRCCLGLCLFLRVRAFLEYLLLFLVFGFVFVTDALGEPPPCLLPLGLPPGLLLLPLFGLGLGLGLVPVPLPLLLSLSLPLSLFLATTGSGKCWNSRLSFSFFSSHLL